MRAAVLAAALALSERSGCYLVRSTRAETFHLPMLKMTTAELGQDTDKKVVVAAEEAPGWLPTGVYPSVPDPHRPAEAVGVRLCGC
jgi:hypothetical protein